MDALTLLDLLADDLNRATQVPLSGGKAVVDREKTLELIEKIRAALPGDILEAEQIKREREKLLTDAARDAEQQIQEAREQARVLLSEHEIVAQATAEARAIVMHAKDHATQIRRAANDYAKELLANMESMLEGHVELLSKNRESLKHLIQ
jgi:cell division septum initiation protein DivIVA